MRRQDQAKGIFCLETSNCEGVKDQTTVVPLLELLATHAVYQAPFRRFDVGTLEEFDLYLEKWCGAAFDNYPILYLAFHGSPGALSVGGGDLRLEDLAERLDGRCKGRVIHLGSCGTANVHGRRLSAFLARTGALAVCGYRTDVAWMESAAFDLLLLGGLQHRAFRVDSMRAFDRELKKTAPGLYKSLGFRFWSALPVTKKAEDR